MDMTALTPVENRNGVWYKREDLLRHPDYGVNGAKFRACNHLMTQAVLDGADHVVSAASVLSPQSAMAAVLAEYHGLKCTVIVGGTTPEKAVLHKAIALAVRAGAQVESIKVGYNPALQSAALRAAEAPGVWRLPYGITTPSDASLRDVEAFVRVGSPQTANLPEGVTTLVLPFGSGNTGVGVLYGLHDARPTTLRKVVLMGIGPDRLAWAEDRLASLGRSLTPDGVELQHVPLHPWWATYGDKMHETLDGIVLHPTYEGKIARYLNTWNPDWWTRRDGTTAFWIVGGPLA